MATEILAAKGVFGYSGGTFSDEELLEARRCDFPLTMDCALPGTCLNHCRYCGFLDVNPTGKLQPPEILRVFEEFAALGGRSIKILGEGEPMLRPDMLDLLAAIHRLGMTPVLFTCGDTLGCEELARKSQGRSCDALVDALLEFNVTVMLKYERQQQDDLVQRHGYSALRGKALDRLLARGFNACFPSRLGFAIVLLKENYDEVPVIYDYALEHNIYPLVCPLMPVGRTAGAEARSELSPNPDEIGALTCRLRVIARQKAIPLSAPSDFPGGRPCDISRAGFYMNDVGDVHVCEADEPVGTVRAEHLRDLWRRCSERKDYKFGPQRWAGLCFPKRRVQIIPKQPLARHKTAPSCREN